MKSFASFFCVVAASLLASTSSLNSNSNSLRDLPISGAGEVVLDGLWTARAVSGPNEGLEIPSRVPGDLITDLQNANVIPDPFLDLTFKNSSIWAKNSWRVSTTFSVPDASYSLLVFDGIKMGATIAIDGKTVATANDQFYRYNVSLDEAVRDGKKHELSVTFDPAIDTGGRFVACSGGWDWAPYLDDFEKSTQARTFSRGIWKSVYVVSVKEAAITHVVPQIFYLGDYPTEPLSDDSHGGFDVSVRVHAFSPKDYSGTIHASSEWGAKANAPIQLKAGVDTPITVSLGKASDVRLWWPAGLGSQKLYNISISLGSASAVRRVGFRAFYLVTGNDTDASYVARAATEEGTESFTMFFRVNGAAVLSRGANMIPMEVLEGRMSADAHRIMVQSAADAHFNTIRVWGGGMFLPRAFYDACDELGMLVYHDMQYAQQGHSPVANTVQDLELRHQIRRLSSHPSIAIWDGCNECQVVMNTSTGIYASFVMQTVADEDKSRAVWPSCPALGWTKGVHKLSAMPNGGSLITPKAGDAGWSSIETHGPYQHGSGFPAVNGAADMQLFSSNIPISVSGEGLVHNVDQKNVFASEFGCVAMSSWESMSPTLSKNHWGLHGGSKPDTCTGSFTRECTGGNVFAQRNYPQDNLLDVYFGSNASGIGEMTLKRQLFQSLISQALNMKGNIETRRGQLISGLIVWQFGEVWPTGGWGSLEYGSGAPGQVLGGRWKPLHHWYESVLYNDVLATCGAAGKCYVTNDNALSAFHGKVTVSSLEFATGKTTPLSTVPVSLDRGFGTKQYFDVPAAASLDSAKHMLVVSVFADGTFEGSVASENPVLLASPKNLALPKSHLSVSIANAPNADGSIDVTITSSAFSLFTTLTTLAQGRFSDNAFVMSAGSRTLHFFPNNENQLASLKATVRAEDVSSYL